MLDISIREGFSTSAPLEHGFVAVCAVVGCCWSVIVILVLGWWGSGDVRKLRGGLVVVKGAEDTGLDDARCWAGEGPV
ncbi:hypothetical protein [Corynebacterium argentoratense]|uniref:hypothetical protein n=1 Tax=Corynebacterium argentoratense TaxID=42817 RepID=UPI001F35DAC2|nr:hypothetical protein [Corynebacterium argentoratense]MCF1694288.1 hypothetical protein [Corynebacterium argentoratense]MCF1735859.1 hypothetical protein [Corynebacterium argentoratense]